MHWKEIGLDYSKVTQGVIYIYNVVIHGSYNRLYILPDFN